MLFSYFLHSLLTSISFIAVRSLNAYIFMRLYRPSLAVICWRYITLLFIEWNFVCKVDVGQINAIFLCSFTDYRDIKEDTNRMKDVDNIYKVLKAMVGEAYLPNESDFIGLYGRVCKYFAQTFFLGCNSIHIIITLW